MTVTTLSSEEARRQWRDMLDEILAGKVELVIERYTKPIAVVVNYNQWQQLKKQRLQLLDQLSREVDEGEYFTQEQVEQGLRDRGLVD